MWLFRITSIFLCIVIMASAGIAEASWHWDKYQPIWPEGRSNFAWAWDYERDVAVMYGGGGWLETREWDGERWYQADLMNLPELPESDYAITFHSITFDPISRQMMLANYELIRLYDGTTWTIGEPVPLNTGERVRDIAGDSVNLKVYALVEEVVDITPVGLRLTVWDGIAWSDFSDPIPFLTRSFMAVNSINGDILVCGENEQEEAIALLWSSGIWNDLSPGDPDVEFSGCVAVHDPAYDRFVIHTTAGPSYYSCYTLVLEGGVWSIHVEGDDRAGPGMIFDPVRNKVLRFGGLTDWYFGLESSALFEWSGTEWVQIPHDEYGTLSGTPYYDEKENRMLMLVYEGEYPDNYTIIYEWLSNEWVPLPETILPQANLWGQPVWYPANETAVIVQGWETWVWQNGTWSLAAPEAPPHILPVSAVAFDPNMNRIIHFGNHTEGDETIWEMWAWDGTNWEELVSVTPPELDKYARPIMGTDFQRNRVVLIDPNKTETVWEWDGYSWRSIAPATAPLYTEDNRFFVYVPTLKRLLMVQYKYWYPRNNYAGCNAIHIWNGGDWVLLENTFPAMPQDSVSAFQPVWDGKNNELIACHSNFRGKIPAMACPEAGVAIWMPETQFSPGDGCSCEVTVCNPDQAVLRNHPLFVLLEIAGTYFFAPSFSDFDHYLDAYPEYPPGETMIEVLPSFPWPEGAGSFSGARFIAALTDPNIQVIVGEMDTFEFGWGE